MLLLLPWLIVGTFLGATVLGSYSLVAFFRDPKNRSYFPTVITILGINVCLVCLLLIPADIYNVSNASQSYSDYASNAHLLLLTYYMSYGSLLVIGFALIPYAYFYYEEERYEDIEDGQFHWDRAWSAFKLTLGFMLCAACLVVLALVFGYSSKKTNSSDGVEAWIKNLLSSIANGGESTMRFLVGSLSLIGLVLWALYTGFGLSYLPISLLKVQNTSRDAEYEDSTGYLAGVTTDLAEIHRRLELRGSPPTQTEAAQLRSLEQLQRRLKHKLDHLKKSRDDLFLTCMSVLAPAFQFLGILIASLALIVVTSVGLSVADCTLHHRSTCTPQTGYFLMSVSIANPLDYLFLVTSKAYPIDYIILSIFTLLLFAASVAAISRVGLWVLCLRNAVFRRKGTSPQSLLLGCWILMFIVMALSVSLVRTAPQYASFGSQHCVSGTKVSECSLEVACVLNFDDDNKAGRPQCNQCRLSQIATLIQSVNVAFPYMGMAFYWCEWIFLGTFLLGIFFGLLSSSPVSAPEGSDSDADSISALVL